MAIDPSIPLAGQQPQFANPLQVFQQAQQMQLQRQQQQALAEERQATIQQKNQALADADAYRQAIQGSAGMTPEQLLESVRIHAPHSFLEVQKAIDESRAKAASAKESTAKAAEAQSLAAQHQQEYIGHLADQFDQSDYNPAIVNAGLNEAVQHFPEWKAQADALRQVALQGGHDAIKAALAPLRAPGDLKSHQETANLAAQTPTLTAKATQDTRATAAGLLASATNAQDYATKYATLDPQMQPLFPPPQAWTPKLAPTLQRMGMTPEQQATNTVARQNTEVARQNAATAAGHLAEDQRHNAVVESYQDPTSPKRQDALEQQYRGVLQRTLSSRSGGMGMEDQKVNQAVHLLALMDQNKDPKTGQYNIPKAQYAELASGLATLVSPNGRPTDSMRGEIEQRTAKGDLAGMVTYLTGTPVTGSTQDIFKMLRDSIERQGSVAESNRESYFSSIRAMAPTELADERRQKLEQSLQLNSVSKRGTSAPQQKPIPGIPGGVAELRDGKWIRVK